MSQTKAELINAKGDAAFDTDTLYIDSTNNRVGVGTTTPSGILHAYSGTAANNVYINTATSAGYDAVLHINAGTATGETILNLGYGGDGDYAQIKRGSDNSLRFQNNNAERARITSSGQLLVGTSSASTADKLIVQANTASSTGAAVLGLQVGTTTVSAGIDLGYLNYCDSSGNRGAWILGEGDGTWTSGTSHPTRLVFSTTADGASSPTERMRINSAGNVGVGNQVSSIGNYGNTGVGIGSAGFVLIERSGDAGLFVNRTVNDGSLVQFAQAGTQEGSISVSGTTVSYNGAHLSRWSQLAGIDPYDKTVRPEILRGTVMSNLDEMCDWIDPASGNAQDNEQLNKTKISDVEGDKNVAGVFQSWDDDDDTWVNDYYLAMTGDFVIRVAAGTSVERGDLLMSAGDGTAKPQDDDIIRSKTIAKVTSTTVSCTHPDGSYCVPCVLMAC